MMSCKRSIKANHYLNEQQARVLLKDLALCENPFNCPHGRPVLIHFTNSDMERMFKRIQDPIKKTRRHQFMQIILASQSPRRQELLKRVVPTFTIAPADIDETVGKDGLPAEYVAQMAAQKQRL